MPFHAIPYPRYQKCLWDIMEKPHTSSTAKVWRYSEVNISPYSPPFRTDPGLEFSLLCQYILPQTVSFISFIFVVVSTVGMTLNTMPAIRYRC